MDDPTMITVANKTFDDLYKDLKPQLEKTSGKTCYARYDAKKGLRIKRGVDNRLPLDRITDARGKKFADAADIFKQAIDYQYPGQMVGDKTLGEELVQSVMTDLAKGDRISAPELKELYEKLHAYADKYGLNAATSEANQLSSVATSRLVQSNASVAAGEALLKRAIIADLSTRRFFRDNPGCAAARADKVLAGIDLTNGLCASSYLAADEALQNVRPEILVRRNLGLLLGLLDMRTKIQTASRQFARLNNDLPKFVRNFSEAKRYDVEVAIRDRRAIMQELGALSFPTGLNNPEKITELIDRLERNYDQLNSAFTEIEHTPLRGDDAALKHLSQQKAETLALAMALRSYAGYANKNAAAASPIEFSRTDLVASLSAMQNASVIVPKTLWNAPTRQANDTFKVVGEQYNANLQKSQALWGRCLGGDPKVTLENIEAQLRITLAFNDAMLDSFERVEAIRGDRASYEEIAEYSLRDTQEQRHQLNLQLGFVRALQRKAIEERARQAAGAGSANADREASAAGASEKTTPTVTPESGADESIASPENLEADYASSVSIGGRTDTDCDSIMTVRRVTLSKAHDEIAEENQNSVSETVDDAPHTVFIEDFNKRAGRYATSGRSAQLYQPKDTIDDGRTRILDILEGKPPRDAKSGSGSLRNPHDTSMVVQSRPASPHNSRQSPTASTSGGDELKNPNDLSMGVESLPASPRNPLQSPGAAASGAGPMKNPEMSPASIRSVSSSRSNSDASVMRIPSPTPPPDYQPEAASSNLHDDFEQPKTADGADIDLYGADSDISDENWLNSSLNSQTGSDEEAESSDLP